jgi:hypothetical protein
MSKRDEIVAEIRKMGERLGRAPSQAEFRREIKISWYQIYKHFGGMREAVRAAGFEPGPRGGPLDVNALVLDWACVVRDMGRLPSRAEYVERGKHHAGTLHARVGWSEMAHRFVLLVREFHLEQPWKDVLEIVWGRFPQLKEIAMGRFHMSSQPSAFSVQSTALKHRGPEEAEEKDVEDRGIVTSGNPTPAHANPARSVDPGGRDIGNAGEQVTGQFGRIDASHGMRLGKVVAAALAVQILMASAVGIAQLQTKPFTAEYASSDMQVMEPAGQQGCPPKCTTLVGRVLYGAPLELAAMAHAPTNEAGVIFLFGALAAGLGFRVERLQKAFPDCEAKREIVPGKWERVRIEFEFESRNFKEHRHDPDGCEVIVCWRHNWVDCPERLEVVELEEVVKSGDR